jgi:hypothetical protein
MMFHPLGNSTVLPAAGWHPEPRTRGTFSILSSCLITMSLCIWTSLHLNLPEHKKEHLQKYRKLGWMMLGLIAPEMVVWNAWEQRKKMRKVSKLMQEKDFMPVERTLWKRVRKGAVKAWHWTLTCLLLRAGDLPEFAEPTPYRPYNGRIHSWTDVHSWLVVMGGFSFEDSAEEDQQFMPENRQRINITIRLFEYMLEMRDHLIPDISRETIQDKSKSDRLAKLLTCWQAGYFCIQCVYRLSQQLSITLLELNVFAHALCALTLFIIWSDKPRDVCEPTLIVGEEAMDICAIFCLDAVGGNHLNRKYLSGYRVKDTPEHPESTLEIIQPTTFSCSHGRTCLYGAIGAHTIKVLETHWVILRSKLDVTQFTLDARDLRRLQRVSKLVQRERIHFFGPNRISPHNMPNPLRGHSLARTTNWCLDTENAVHLMVDYNLAGSRVALRCSSGPSSAQMALDRRRRLEWLRFVTGLTFAGTCYGGLHLAAWKTPFASRAEAILWRAASVSIMATGPLCVLVTCLRFICDKIDSCSRSSPRSVTDHSEVIVSWMEVILLCSSTTWYITCRVFIIVESFIMLAHIPDRALQVPTWSAYVPHIV